MIHFHCDAHGEIDRAKTLSLARQGTSDHDEIPVFHRCDALIEGIHQQWALNLSVFLGNRAALTVGSNHSRLF